MELVLICDSNGLVEQVLRCEPEQFCSLALAQPLTALFDEGCAEKVNCFLSEVIDNGSAFGWELTTLRQSELVPLTCMAVMAGDKIMITAADSYKTAALAMKEQLELDESACNATLLEKLSAATLKITDREQSILDVMQNINSELSAMQRELVRKNREQELLYRKLFESEERTRALNDSLAEQVKEKVEELRMKEQLLISRGRQADMGDMLNNIAHQWRQPLNALSMVFGYLQLVFEQGELDKECMNTSTANGFRLIQKMSDTINDFRDIYHPDREKIAFPARAKIKQTVGLLGQIYESFGITLSIAGENDCMLYGFPGEYTQVILNLLSNARDAIVDSGVRDGEIVISIEVHEQMGVVMVRDNGGGIPDMAILDKIFEPYFTTKSTGTGIGLNMSKTIIESNMNGRIEVKNVPGGCEFKVSVPLYQPEP